MQCTVEKGGLIGRLSVSKNYGHREPARRLVHPRVVSLALRAIHLLAIPQNLRETYVF